MFSLSGIYIKKRVINHYVLSLSHYMSHTFNSSCTNHRPASPTRYVILFVEILKSSHDDLQMQ